MKRISLVVALLCLVAPALRAQADQVFGGFVSVDLVLVDVVVMDPAGDPVLDLERDDFRLYRDGSRPRGESPVDTLAAPPPRRLVTLPELRPGRTLRQRGPVRFLHPLERAAVDGRPFREPGRFSS